MALEERNIDERLSKDIGSIELCIHLEKFKNVLVSGCMHKMLTKVNVFGTLTAANCTLGPANGSYLTSFLLSLPPSTQPGPAASPYFFR